MDGEEVQLAGHSWLEKLQHILTLLEGLCFRMSGAPLSCL